MDKTYFGIITDKKLEHVEHITDIPEEYFEKNIIGFGPKRPEPIKCAIATKVSARGDWLYLFYGSLTEKNGGTFITESTLITVYDTEILGIR